jgi:hypothetical protein
MFKVFELARYGAWRRVLSIIGKDGYTKEELAAANKEEKDLEVQIAKVKLANRIVEQLVARFGEDIKNDEEIDGGDAVEFLVETLSEALAVFKPIESARMEYFHGRLNSDGASLSVNFQVHAGASVAEKDAAFMAALAQQADINYLSIGEDGNPILQQWVVVYGEDGLYFHCQAEDREHAVDQCENAYPDDVAHVAVPADSKGQFVIETITEDPMGCPKCGGRTKFEEVPVSNNLQIHVCMRCNHSFIADHDEETSTV